MGAFPSGALTFDVYPRNFRDLDPLARRLPKFRKYIVDVLLGDSTFPTASQVLLRVYAAMAAVKHRSHGAPQVAFFPKSTRSAQKSAVGVV